VRCSDDYSGNAVAVYPLACVVEGVDPKRTEKIQFISFRSHAPESMQFLEYLNCGSSPMEVSMDQRNGERLCKNVDLLSKHSYKIHPNLAYSKADGTSYSSAEDIISNLYVWPWFDHCVPPLTKAYRDQRIEPYTLADRTFLATSPVQADMLFVSTSLADEFAKAAQILVDYNVFLECGIPTIVQMVQMVQIATNATVATVNLCTNWSNRGKEEMILSCLEEKQQNYGVLYPYKLSTGLESWGRLFDTTTWSSSLDDTV